MPCQHCQEILKTRSPVGYKIRNIYYSATNNQIICVKYNKFIEDQNNHVSHFFKNKN